jgi:hypothetical protein
MKLPDFIQYNRTAAAAALILVILAAVPLGTVRSVNALERKVEKLYDSGDREGGSVRSDLARMADYGQNLFAIADAIGCADPSFSSALSDLRAALGSPIMPADSADALMSAASLTYNRILSLPDLSETQKNSAISYFYEMDSTRMRLQNNEAYARAADRYNDALDSFPASLFCLGKSPAITFGH